MLGEVDVLRRRAPALFRDYEARDNRYAASGVATNYANLAWLVNDGPRKAREMVERAEGWFPATEFHLPHYDAAISHVPLDLYDGRAGSALERVEALWTWLRASLMLTVEPVLVDALFLRLRATLAAAGQATFRRPLMLAAAAAGIHRLAKTRSVLGRPFALLLSAGALALSAQPDRAQCRLRAAIVLLDESGLALLAACARLTLGRLVGGSEGALLRTQASARLTVGPLGDPDAFASLFVPGFGS